MGLISSVNLQSLKKDLILTIVTVNDVAANSIQSKSVADQIIKLGRRAIVISCDVSDSIAVDAMLCEIVKEFKRLDVCCANAGVARVGSLLNSTPEERKLIFDINLHGVMNTSIAAAKQMKLQGTGKHKISLNGSQLKSATQGGRIIPTVSIVAIRPFPMLSTYSASKWAVKGFVQVRHAIGRF